MIHDGLHFFGLINIVRYKKYHRNTYYGFLSLRTYLNLVDSFLIRILNVATKIGENMSRILDLMDENDVQLRRFV